MNKIWENYEDIPNEIKKFMDDTINSKVFYIDNNYYCPICRTKLDNNKCNHCNKEYKLIPKYTLYENFDDYEDHNYFYAFDIVDNDILLYSIENVITASNGERKSLFRIENVYKIYKDGVLYLSDNTYCYFKWIEDNIINDSKVSLEEYSNEITNNYIEFDLPPWIFTYIYPNNLEELKETELYKNSNLWKLKEYLNNNEFTLKTLTFGPLCIKDFTNLILSSKGDDSIIVYRNGYFVQ